MRNYSHIISKLFNEPTLLTPARHAAICHLLETRLGAPSALEPQAANPTKRFYPAAGMYGEQADNEGITYFDQLRTVGNVAIIPIHGTLVAHPEDIAMSECGCAMEDVAKAIDMAESNEDVKTILFDFRTPGGSVTKIPEVGRKIFNSRKDTIAFTDSECCSGGIWLASQCEKFYATQSSRVGSVGVYTLCLDMSVGMKKDGVKVNAISAGKYKLLGAYWKPMSSDETAIIQKGVDKIYAQFKEAMESRRVVDDKSFGNGLVFDGEEAAAIGFTDGVVEGVEDILDGMVE